MSILLVSNTLDTESHQCIWHSNLDITMCHAATIEKSSFKAVEPFVPYLEESFAGTVLSKVSCVIENPLLQVQYTVATTGKEFSSDDARDGPNSIVDYALGYEHLPFSQDHIINKSIIYDGSLYYKSKHLPPRYDKRSFPRSY